MVEISRAPTACAFSWTLLTAHNCVELRQYSHIHLITPQKLIFEARSSSQDTTLAVKPSHSARVPSSSRFESSGHCRKHSTMGFASPKPRGEAKTDTTCTTCPLFTLPQELLNKITKLLQIEHNQANPDILAWGSACRQLLKMVHELYPKRHRYLDLSCASRKSVHELTLALASKINTAYALTPTAETYRGPFREQIDQNHGPRLWFPW
jgi:hypothetical protein